MFSNAIDKMLAFALIECLGPEVGKDYLGVTLAVPRMQQQYASKVGCQNFIDA